MKFEYSPGLFGYGPRGADGSIGIQGFSLYFTDYDPQSEILLVSNSISNNRSLWRSNYSTSLPNDRKYLTGELFVDNFGNIYKIDLSLQNKFIALPIKISTVTYFSSDENETDNNFIRFYNSYDASVASDKYIIDNVYSDSNNPNYTSVPSKIYGIYPKNFLRIEYTNIINSSYNLYTLYSSGEIIYDDDHKVIAIVRDTANNTYKIGNVSTNIRDVNIVFDVSSLKKNSMSISVDTSTSEILSNADYETNALFSPIFNTDPASFKAQSLSTTNLKIEWNLYDFTPDACVTGNLYIYEKTPNQSFNPLIVHDVSTPGELIIEELVQDTTYSYYIKVLKNGWMRSSRMKDISINGETPFLYVNDPCTLRIDASADGLFYGGNHYTVSVSSNSNWNVNVPLGDTWIFCNPKSGISGSNEYFDVSVTKNTTSYQRIGTVRITSTAPTKDISIYQDASTSLGYSISLSPTFMVFYQNAVPYPPYNGYTYVTASGPWTASVISDTDSMIESYTLSGAGSTNAYITVYYNYSYTYSSVATIRFTCGTATADLTLCRDGKIYTCS